MEPSQTCKSSPPISSTKEKNVHPRTVVLEKDDSCGFGFTLRHFIVYPPTALKSDSVKDNKQSSTDSLQWKTDDQNSPMDTIFIREVSKGSPADETGLHKGDRIIAINNQPVTGKTYSDIVNLIRRSGNSIKLLVVPKEDDILQLYFASSAYQPVYRGHKQHKYFVPSYHDNKHQNKISKPCESIHFGDERTTKLHTSLGECDCQNGHDKLECRFSEARLLHEQKKKHELFYAQEVSFLSPHETHKKYLVKKDSEFPVPVPLSPSRINSFEEESCPDQYFSDTANTEHSLEVVSSADDDVNVVHALPCRTIDAENSVDNKSGNIWDNKSQSVGSYTSQTEGNNHYMSSDFRNMAHCDKSESGSSCVAALISNTMKGLMPHLSSFHADQYFGRDVSESSMNLSGDSMDSFCSLNISETCDSSSGAPKSNISQNMSDLFNSSLSDSECFKSTQGYSTNAVNARTKSNVKKHLVTNGITDDSADNCSNSSINLVAQRCHLFESGTVLAQSLERMSMYRSELSRMSKPNHIVSARMAHFEHLSPRSGLLSSQLSSVPMKNLEEASDVIENQMPCEEKNIVQKNRIVAEETASGDSSALAGYVTSDQESCETLIHEDNQEIHTSSQKTVESSSLSSGMVLSSSEENNAHHSPVISGVVYRRKTVPASEQDECHVTRRISYLRATAEDRMSDDLEISGEDDDDSSEVISPSKDHRIQKLKAFFGEKTPRLKHALQPVSAPEEEEEEISAESSELAKSVYGWLICKVVTLEGKRSSDRSWRHVWAILRNNTLYLLKERREPSTRSLTCDDHVINVRNSVTNVASDYQKRKHVLRLTLLNGTEYLVQAENHANMMEWLEALQVYAAEVTKKCPGMLSNISVLEKAAAYEQQIQSKTRTPSQQGQHAVRKLVFRHRSPSDSSPAVKTRRASQGDELVLSKIGIIWRDRMVQGWKKVHGGSSQNSSKCASFGVRLEDAPSAVTNEHVPLLIELCAQIVETRGLDMIGIYRVPGNNAAVSLLTETVNQGLEGIDLSDTRWNDVNIVSSLLKAYFRKLPEPLLTSHLYSKFILASKVDDPIKRLVAIKKLLQELPVHHYETLRFLMHHLKKVVDHSDVNKMEARNLAIVFGPTLARSRDNNMITMVTDMSHQCYLVETLITYVNWLFEDHSDTIPFEMNVKDKRKTHPPPTIHSSALLSNIDKLDRSRGDGLQDILPQEIFTSLRNTTRHLRNRNRKKAGDWESEMAFKRSGIIEQDELTCDLFDNLELNESATSKADVHNSRLMPSPQGNSYHVTDKDDCSSLATESSKRNSSFEERTSGIDSMCSIQQVVTSDISDHDICDHSTHTETDEIVLHTYDELSALAQEKIRNFERETKALLKRGVAKPKATSKPGHVEWEQIEREWQKAKQELEQEDLLDHLADDPSFLSLLLCRGDDSFQSDAGTIQDKNSSLNSCMSSDSPYIVNPTTTTSSEVASNHNLQKNINELSSVSTYQKSLSVSLTKDQFMHPCVTEDRCITDHSEESVHQKELMPVVSGIGSSVSRSTSITSMPVHQDKQLETPSSMARTSCVKSPRTTLTITTTLPLADTVITAVSCSANINVTTGPTNYLHSPTYSRSEIFGMDSCVTTSSSNSQLNMSDTCMGNCQRESSVTHDSARDYKTDNQLVPPKS